MVVCLGCTCYKCGVLSGHALKYSILDGNAAPCRQGWQRSSMASAMAMQLQLRHVVELPSNASRVSDAREVIGRLFGFH